MNPTPPDLLKALMSSQQNLFQWASRLTKGNTQLAKEALEHLNFIVFARAETIQAGLVETPRNPNAWFCSIIAQYINDRPDHVITKPNN